jgi:hypothetical protein
MFVAWQILGVPQSAQMRTAARFYLLAVIVL